MRRRARSLLVSKAVAPVQPAVLGSPLYS